MGFLDFAQPVVDAAGSIFGIESTKQMNKRAENFAWRMHAQQRADHWQDLEYANTYNSPTSQMNRLKDAGLNPHLVYGHGQATQPSAPSRGANVSSPNFKAPQVGPVGSVVFNALQAKQLQSNIARTDAETQAILSRTFEQDYRNTFLTEDMFAVEYENKKRKAAQVGMQAEAQTDIMEANANIRNLELDNLNLLSGRDIGTTRKYTPDSDGTSKANLILNKMQTDIAATAARTSGQISTNQMLQYEANLIKNFGIDKQSAQQILSNIFKLVLLKMSKN